MNSVNAFELKDFPARKIFVNPEENFRKLLFHKALYNSNDSAIELAKKLNIGWKHIYQLKYGFRKKGQLYNIRLDLFYKLVNIANISLSESHKNIKCLRYGRNSKDIPNIFPLKYDHRLATLIGHVTGDGHLKDIVYNFEYRNSSKELIEKVYDMIFDIFNIKCLVYSSKDGTSQVEVPSIVGYILHKAGAPAGNKIKSEFEVPEWIIEGDKDIVSSYLGALVDDEFWMSNKNNS